MQIQTSSPINLQNYLTFFTVLIIFNNKKNAINIFLNVTHSEWKNKLGAVDLHLQQASQSLQIYFDNLVAVYDTALIYDNKLLELNYEKNCNDDKKG